MASDDSSSSDLEVMESKTTRKTNLPSKLKEYDVELSLFGEQASGNSDQKGWCIIEWEGENTYDPLPYKKVASLDGENPKFQLGEKVIGVYTGRPYKETIAAISSTKSLVEKEYLKSLKKNEAPKVETEKVKKRKVKKRDEDEEETKVKKLVQPKTTKPQSSKADKTKKKSDGLTVDQIKRKQKALQDKVKLQQMKAVDYSTIHTNFSSSYQSSENLNDDLHDNFYEKCKQAIRNKQEIELLKKAVSSVQAQLSNYQVSLSCDTLKKSVQAAENSVPEEVKSTPRTPTSSGNKEIPHHLKSNASKAGSLKKAARCLMIGLFTVEERKTCTLSGENKPKFDEQRVTLMHNFLRQIHPKTYDAFAINRVIGQVAIETRAGRHQSSDLTAKSLFADE